MTIDDVTPPSAKYSAEQLEHINKARYWFDTQKEEWNGEDRSQLITDALAKAGVGLEALDPEGKKSAKDLQQEIAAAVKQAHINKARYWFTTQSSAGNRTDYSQFIDKALAKAGVGLEALDSTGKKSAKGVARDLRKKLSTNPELMRHESIAAFVRGGKFMEK